MSDRRPKNWRPGRRPSDRARRLAFEVLCSVEADGAFANLVLPKRLSAAHFNKPDASFATNICYGTLRLQGRWDAIISLCTQGRNAADLDLPVKILLRMGAHQLLELNTPAHAAIFETVSLARNTVGTGASGFVNAVLRRISERTLRQWREALRDVCGGGKYNSVDFLAAWFSHPQWIVRAYAEALGANGREKKDLLKVLAANNEAPEVALAAREISVEELQADIARGKMHSEKGRLVDSAVILKDGDPHRIFAVRDRLAGVQDEGSQLVAQITAHAPIAGNDGMWLDMCAGPGGKTALLAAAAGKRGAHIYANELHAHRLSLVESAVSPRSADVSLRNGDGRDIGEEEPERYDRILIDAPCTGIGSLRRRPESRWRKNAADALNLAKVQGELLDSGMQALRVGGLLVYSTCSPYLRETHEVVRSFLARHPEAELRDIVKTASALSQVTFPEGRKTLQLWPDTDASDAMFVAGFTKK